MSERIVDNPANHGWVEDNGKWVWGASGGSAGAGMVISETEPADKVEGMQWLNPTNGLVLFWDDEKWLQMPGGKDGVDGLWTDEGNDLISYAGNIEVGGSAKANTVSASASGAYTLDLSDTQNFVLTLSGAVSLSATGGREGQTGFIKFVQGSGGDTVSISGDFVTPDGGGVTLSSDAGAVDVVPYVFSGGVVLGNTTMGVA